MFKNLLLVTAMALTPVLAQAEMMPLKDMPAGDYTLDPSHASLTWRVSHLGLSTYTARFTKLDATLNFDPKDPAKSKVVAKVNPLSVETDFPTPEKKDFDKELATGDQWFNANKFPDITFESGKIEKTGEKTGLIHGKLTFMGVTKPLTLAATFNGAYLKKPFVEIPALGFSATATIKRSDWGLATYVPYIGDEVQLLIETEFHQEPKNAKQ